MVLNLFINKMAEEEYNDDLIKIEGEEEEEEENQVSFNKLLFIYYSVGGRNAI